MRLYQWIIILTCLYVTGGQVLNGYINPLWMSDRRARARAYFNNQQTSLPITSDYYTSRGASYVVDRPDLRRMSEYYYMDDSGRYHPVYRDDRIVKMDPRTYYTPPAATQHHEYVALPDSSQTVAHTEQENEK